MRPGVGLDPRLRGDDERKTAKVAVQMPLYSGRTAMRRHFSFADGYNVTHLPRFAYLPVIIDHFAATAALRFDDRHVVSYGYMVRAVRLPF